MSSRNRSNPLALAVLVCLYERPMHPYEVATTLRRRGKHQSVRLNYGSLYSVVKSLERRRLIEAAETQKQGRLPERTVYSITQAGSMEAQDWLAELVSMPTKEYPAFEAALSFLPALPPEEVAGLLDQRADHLEIEVAQADATREMMEKYGLPRLLWVEEEYAGILRRAELDYVRSLVVDIRHGTLEGLQWWRDIHQTGITHPPPGFHWPDGTEQTPFEGGQE